MKGGGCRVAFIEWSKCVDHERDAGTDFTEECREKTMALRRCMMQYEEYYKPLLEEEEEMMAEQTLVTPDTAETPGVAASGTATKTENA
ncbi:hypothetical protein D9Q98_000598 [Chlorella vulgaris]|uniref:GCK domain-containing protein n=1 Tax=Chlorella vulgaris TaxID=3077 RepID=A0A9D4Z2D1_CHLVU|nr:hypothetical protein D9Q98_000598 [Chlorella vulgaris]